MDVWLSKINHLNFAFPTDQYVHEFVQQRKDPPIMTILGIGHYDWKNLFVDAKSTNNGDIQR